MTQAEPGCARGWLKPSDWKVISQDFATFSFHILEASFFFTYALGQQILSGSAMLLGLVPEPHGVFFFFLGRGGCVFWFGLVLFS